uniref:Uncharacterized protein n=1 Tax=Anolis carolinensis TaxID=28377 RepID=A0A803TCC1_ANOCA
MNVLPKLLYLFRTIPIIRNNKIFKNWSIELSKFIWQGKKPRVKMLNLTDKKKRGGLGLPDLQLYYEASALGWVKDWATLKDKSMLNLEGFDLRTGWHAYMWYDKKKLEKKFGNHFIRAALIKVWEKYKQNFYTRTPRWISPLEACHRRETPRRNWLTYNDIIRKRERKWTLKSQEEMKKIDQEISWFKYFQIKEYFNQDNKIGFEENETTWDRIMKSDKKIISKLYNKLLEWSTLVTIKEIYVAEENENDNNDLEENVRMK